MRLLLKVRIRGEDPRFIEALDRATSPDDVKPPKDFTIAHEVVVSEFTYTATYSGIATPEAFRTAASVLEEVLGLCKMLENAVRKRSTT